MAGHCNGNFMDKNSKTVSKKKSSKGIIVVGLIVLVFIILIGGTIGILLSFSSNNSQTPNSASNITPEIMPENEVENIPSQLNEEAINQDNEFEQEFIYAVINNDNTISVFNESNEELILSLDTNEKRSLSWNPSTEILSVLADTSTGSNPIYNLLVYSFIDENWTQVTNYTLEGIHSYRWVSNTEILFNQGIGTNNWLHIQDISKEASVIKIVRVDGDLIEISPDKTKYIFDLKDSNTYSFFNFQGDLLWNLDNVFFENENNMQISIIPDNRIIFAEDSNKLYYSGTYAQFFNTSLKTAINQDLSFELNVDYVKPLCTYSANEFIGYTVLNEFNLVEFYRVHDAEFTNETLYSFGLNRNEVFNEDSLTCLPNKSFYFSTDFNNSRFWFKNGEDTIEQIELLLNSQEIALYE